MNREEHIDNNRFYHIYNRGNDRELIFGDESDYRSFLEKMKSLAVRYSVNVPIYTLMPNHYHLIAIQNTGGNLSKMMGALATSAAKRYNLRYGHVGHVFQGPFRNKPVSDDDLWHVACYIHLNPVRAGLVRDPASWKFSNFAEMKVTFSPAETEKKVTFDPVWDGYAAYVAKVLKNEREEKEFWKRMQSHLEGFLPTSKRFPSSQIKPR